jgi:hypothetical protein
VGLGGYDKHPDVKDKKWWEYTKEEIAQLGDAAKDFFIGNAVLPVAMGGNSYLNQAVPDSTPYHFDSDFSEQKDPMQMSHLVLLN